MWSYYGRKTKVIKYYPKPKYSTIIDPFAGTAVYSLFEDNWKNDIILIDKYDVIIRLWKYLQQASEKDILSLPVIEQGKLSENNSWNLLCDEEKWLIGFCSNNGSAYPKNYAGKIGTGFNTWASDKERIAKNLYKIKHWQFILGEYNCIDNINVTWFVDPPYIEKGKYYKHNKIDYVQLSKWCQSRNGQVIVCENSPANWLPFTPLKEMKGQLHKTTEVIWYKE